MDHHGCCGVIESSGFYQVHFAAVALFGGGAQDGEAETERVGQGEKRQAGAHRGRGDDVVAARMADARQSVVFCADDQLRAGRARPGSESGRHSIGGVLNRESVLFQGGRYTSGGPVFLIGYFRVFVEPSVEFCQSRQVARYSLSGESFGFGEWQGSHPWLALFGGGASWPLPKVLSTTKGTGGPTTAPSMHRNAFPFHVRKNRCWYIKNCCSVPV